jgi:hypothetical protein
MEPRFVSALTEMRCNGSSVRDGQQNKNEHKRTNNQLQLQL